MAILIHGFGSNSQEWINSNTKEDLEDHTVISRAILIDYNLSAGIDAAAASVLLQVINQTSNSDKIVLIGHSLGGLIARSIYPDLVVTRNILGILTLGTPHQGTNVAYATNVTNPSSPMYNPFEKSLDEFRQKTEDPLGSVHLAVAVGIYLKHQLFDEWKSVFKSTSEIPGTLERSYDTGKDYVMAADYYNAADYLVPDAQPIQDIQSLNSPANHLSIIGTENSPVVLRWTSEFYDLSGYNGDEDKIVNDYKDVKAYYQANYDAWHTTAVYYSWTCIRWIPTGSCADMDYANRRADLWRDGFRSLE